MDIALFEQAGKKGATAMMITPEHKQEIHNAIAKALQKIVAEKKEQLDLIDVVDIKKFGLAGYASQTSASQR